MGTAEEPANSGHIRKSASWMVRADERILEYLVETDSTTPTEIAELEFIHVSRPHLSERLSTLSEHGLVDALGNGVYQLSPRGWYYLDGAYNADIGEFVDGVSPNELVHHTDKPALWGANGK